MNRMNRGRASLAAAYLMAVTLAGVVPALAAAQTPARRALLTGITPVVSAGPVSAMVASPSPITSISVIATNLSAVSSYLVGYNAATVPADGALTPSLVLDCIILPANATASIADHPNAGTNYSAGLVWIVTSAGTCYTKTTGTVTAFLKAKVQ